MQLWNRSFKQPCYQTEHLQVVPTKNIFSSNFSSSSLAEQSSYAGWQSQTFPFCPFGLSCLSDCPRFVCLQGTLQPDIHEESFLYAQTEVRMRWSWRKRSSKFLPWAQSFNPSVWSKVFESFSLFIFSHLPPPMHWQFLPTLVALSLSLSWFPLPFIT